MDDELPYGWEKISDPHYGTYFIDHVNRRTQYENPVIQAKRAASQASARASRASFTKDPAELCGQRFRTSLVKSSRGLGFTIVGGDDGVDEFLQIKSVVPKGPAWLDGKLQMGDVIVFVNDTCVLGYTHNQIVRLFQSISVGSTVALEVCRGYPLPFDPNDPNTEVVTTIAVDSTLQAVPTEKRLGNLDTNYNFLEGDDISRDDVSALDNNDDIDDLLKGMNNVSITKVEVSVKIVKGNLGFGFTIADSACGQRVKKILDRQRCKNLLEGDILLDINDISLRSLTHDDVVQVLKNCPYNLEATICVQRGCSKTNTNRKPRKLDNRFGAKDMVNAFRSKTPTADIYSTQTREVLPSRPKTPIVDTRSITKTPTKDLNSNGHDMMRPTYAEGNLRLSFIENGDIEEEEINNIVQKTRAGHPQHQYMPVPHAYDCLCFQCQNHRPGTTDGGSSTYESNSSRKANNLQDWWQSQQNNECVEMNITLQRQESGFGFRIVGGIEDRSQVAVGHIVAGGAADVDGRIRSGDEIVSVDNYSVLKASHRQVVQLMNQAATRGQVNLVLRRRNFPAGEYGLPPPQVVHSPIGSPNGQTYDVIVNRTENEGFGFVIISSANKVGSTIGKHTIAQV